MEGRGSPRPDFERRSVMILDLFKIALIVLLVFIMLVLIEYARNPQNGLRGAAQQLKKDWRDIKKGITEEPKVRHIFDSTFLADIRNIVEPYAAIGMEIDVQQLYGNSLPYIGVEFVPKQKLTEEELATLADYIKIKFRRYWMARGITARCFSIYSQQINDVQIRLLYPEFEEEYPVYVRTYQQHVLEKSGSDYGCLHDEELDNELKHVS